MAKGTEGAALVAKLVKRRTNEVQSRTRWKRSLFVMVLSFRCWKLLALIALMRT